MGAKWRDRARGLSLDVALFEARTDDELAVSRNSGGCSTFQNVGETKGRGAELVAGWVINRSWRTVLALTWLDARYEDDFLTCYGVPAPCTIDDPRKNPVPAGSRISGTSPRSAFAEVAWKPGGSTATELAAEWRAQARVATNDLNDRSRADDFTEGWATFALRARHQWQLGPQSRLEGLIRVDNVFDREYAGSVIVNEGNRRFYEPGAPRAWLVGVKFRQGF